MTKDLFIETILALQEQYDKDNANAERLSTIYGADINPNDNRLLTNIIFKYLQKQFPSKDGLCDIEIFCFEQDFGRVLKVEDPIEKLWISLLKNMEVVGEEILTIKYRSKSNSDVVDPEKRISREIIYDEDMSNVKDDFKCKHSELYHGKCKECGEIIVEYDSCVCDKPKKVSRNGKIFCEKCDKPCLV